MGQYEDYHQRLLKIADLEGIRSVLSWDQQTYMPQGSAAGRSRQMSTLAGMTHELSVDPALKKLVDELAAKDLKDPWQKKNVALSSKSLEKKSKLSKEFVIEMSEVVSRAFQSWVKAKSAEDFSIFEPDLTKLVELKRKEAELVGYEDHPYDCLMDEYEPGAKTANIEKLFADVREQLVDFVGQIHKQKQNDESFIFNEYKHDEQWDFGIDLLRKMGYDFTKGRQDISAHPFTTTFDREDVRVTTRVNENDISEMTWSCIHEGGHALYEQGLPLEQHGLPCGYPISLGIHESQSRVWENNVGRSLPYWKGLYSDVQKRFPENLKNVSIEDFYKAINVVKPSFIRTNADELTYHFHIMVRFEIEKALIEGSMKAKDIPQVWNQKYKDYLGIEVSKPSEGCLQDVHWAYASFGYFPTYSLGSFYAAQFYQQAKKDIPGLEAGFAKGDSSPFLAWLRENIHQHGRLYEAEELCERITGEGLNFRYFMDYAHEKYSGIYNFSPNGSIA